MRLARLREHASKIPYPVLCTLLGLVIGWIPRLLHGPIPEKFDILYIKGAVAVWAYYSARLLIGFMVGITRWPARWYLRGPLCGLLMMFPVGLFSIGTPGCGGSCMFWNLVTGSVAGGLIAGIAYAAAGKHHL